jgi:hypothetical protein
MNKDYINHKDSLVKTLTLSAKIILVIAIIVPIAGMVWTAIYDQISVALMIMLPRLLLVTLVGFVVYLFFMSASKALDHLWHIRKHLEDNVKTPE